MKWSKRENGMKAIRQRQPLTRYRRQGAHVPTPGLNAIVVTDAQDSAVSALSARQIAESLAFDFPLVDIREWTPLRRALPIAADLAGVFFFARPFGLSADLIATLRSLEAADIPFVGSDSNTCARAGNRGTIAALLDRNGIPIADNFHVHNGDNLDEFIGRSAESWRGADLSVTVLDGPEPLAMPVLELDSSTTLPVRMYFEDAMEGQRRQGDLDETVANEAHKLAIHAHQLCGLRDVSRMTLSQTKAGLAIQHLVVNPSITRASLVAHALARARIDFGDLVWHLVCNAAARKYGTTDLASRQVGTANILNLLQESPFILDGIHLNSMEGLFLSLMYEDVEVQRSFQSLSGSAARAVRATMECTKLVQQILHWDNCPMRRDHPEFQAFLDRAFDALFDQNAKLRQALRESGHTILRHGLGTREPIMTILTERELVRRLTRLRQIVKCAA